MPLNTELFEAQKELLNKIFEQAQAYTNMILAAGYAGAFAIWALVKDELSSGQTLWSALLLSTSLISFVVWELLGMVVRSRSLIGIAKAVNDAENFQLRMAEHQKSESLWAARYARIWVATVSVSVLTAFAAMAILVLAFVTNLVALYA